MVANARSGAPRSQSNEGSRQQEQPNARSSGMQQQRSKSDAFAIYVSRAEEEEAE